MSQPDIFSLYSVPVHKLPMYANTCVEPLPEAKRIAVEGLGMPMYPQLDAEKPKPVVEQMQAVLQSFSLEGIQP